IRSRTAPARRRGSCPLRLERLETRDVPTTFTVDTLLDSGSGSLRQAVRDANDTPGDDLIAFDAKLSGTITLTSGQLRITDGLTISGPGRDVLAVSGNDTSRVFRVSSGIAVAISGLTISHGRADIGG